jgi:proteasome activator subunit 4
LIVVCVFQYVHFSDTAVEEHGQTCLGKEERVFFIKVILKLLDRGQYSKDNSLAETVSISISILSYVEPTLVLPFVATNFQLALETVSLTTNMH